jgi:hypothetical protein
LRGVILTLITGRFVDSGGLEINGGVIVKLDAPFVDISTDPDSLYTQQERDFAIVNGLLPIVSGSTRGIVLPQTATQNLTYSFNLYRNVQLTDYYFQDGRSFEGVSHLHTDGLYYTGASHSLDSVRLDRVDSTQKQTIGYPFHAVVPNVAIAEFTALIPSQIATDKLPSTIQQITEILINTPQYLALLTQAKWKGAYDPAQIYRKFEEVFYAGSSWIYVNDIPTAGNTPNTGAYWQLRSLKGDAGGTGGNATPYDATGWNNQSWAPSAGVLRNIIEQLAKSSQLASYALINTPALVSPTRTANPSNADRSLALASTQWVGTNFATLVDAALSGSPSVPLPATSDASNRIASTQWVINYLASLAITQRPYVLARKTASQSLTTGTFTAIVFDTKPADSDNTFTASTGTFVAPSNGYYEFSLTVQLSITGTAAYDVVTAYTISGANTVIAQDNSIASTVATSVYTRSGTKSTFLTAGQSVTFRVFANTNGNTIAIAPTATEVSIKKLII